VLLNGLHRPIIVATLCFTLFIVASQILVPYNNYVKILKYLTLSLFAYIITAIIVGGNWSQILYATIIPHIELTPAFAMMFVAILGTTITPYVFVWQASQEAEEDVAMRHTSIHLSQVFGHPL
jgi:Mn2+/Fe2+ NRAMP family transporter